ncbi:MAG: type I-MYXAN CRISPR-associated protein Cas6/Cmx6 [Betaproteobacteria bacterium]|nr:type I-MYXAN CRISPR-associated protein Cas6/Cmx6 [Betaproteobacteria bacterium]
MSSPKIDLHFPVTGRHIPIDHGYPLYSSLSRVLDRPGDPWLHDSDDLGVHLIRGRHAGPGKLLLTTHSRLTLRLAAERIPAFLTLAGKTLQIGDERIHLGIPQSAILFPAANLYAHLVTTKNGQDEVRFDEEIARQLEALGIQGKPQRGPRRAFRIKEKRVVGHTLLVANLTAEESIRLQEAGLGGRRKLGCGVFVPWEGK